MMVRINYNCTLIKFLDGSIWLESTLIVHGGKHIIFQLKQCELMQRSSIKHNENIMVNTLILEF